MSRFGTIGLTIVTIGAGLGLYLVSYSVANERGKIEYLNARIESELRTIETLEAELSVRASLPQLEAWNENYLGLSAPTPKQIIGGETQLASYGRPQTPEAMPELHLALAEAQQTAPAVHTVAYAANGADAPQPAAKAAAPARKPAAPAPTLPLQIASVGGKVAAGGAVVAAAASVDTQPRQSLFSDAFAAEIDAAAAAEQAGFQKVALR